MYLKGIMLGSLFVGAAVAPLSAAMGELSGSMIIAGNGPELPTIARLARAFEKENPGIAVDIEWNRFLHPSEKLKAGGAGIAVTDRGDPELTATPIAWDGIAVVVDFANPIKEVTTKQLAAIFSGKVRQWAQLEEPGKETRLAHRSAKGTKGAERKELATEIQLIDRPQSLNIRNSFEEVLGIVGEIPKSARVIRTDQKAISTVAGNLNAVTYTSLEPALEAVHYGVDVNILHVDQVEATEVTVADGRYKLRRPVLLLTQKEPTPVVEAFVKFAQSNEGQRIVDEIFIPYGFLNTTTAWRTSATDPFRLLSP